MQYLAATPGRSNDPPKTTVVLVNLGTPDAPRSGPVRRYLAQFLGDPRIIELPRWLWRLILHGVILRIRPRQSAKAYQQIWAEDGSPLLLNTEALGRRLQQALDARQPGATQVVVAMRYGNPGIDTVFEQLALEGARRVLVVALFPQYSGTTTGSVMDAVGKALRRWRNVPELRVAGDYHDQPLHIEALARSVERHWQEHGRGDRLLLSFHGIPQRYVDNGDPYLSQCHTTARLLRERLQLDDTMLEVVFQSRVGREPWLMPYTDIRLLELGREGVGRVQVMCPGFALDCLETLEEIAIRNREDFINAGGKELEYIPALNDSDDQVTALLDFVGNAGCGWQGLDSAQQ